MASTGPPIGQSSSSADPIDSSKTLPQLEKLSSDPSQSHSPLRHHHRNVNPTRTVKETHNARSEYSTSQDDGGSQKRINQYLIQQEIGRGSFGAVHLATDQFGNEYAVKEFSKTRLRKRAKSNLLRQRQFGQVRSRSSNSEAGSALSEQQSPQDNSFDLIKEEIAVMKKLNHENLVSLIEVLDDPDDDSLYMVMEMCKKGVVMKIEMDELVEPYEDESCRHWFRDLILGIEYLHAQGVIHRDIKPDNCLLTQDNTLKVVDFGVSEMFEKTDEMKVAKSAGSPAFMAPELCEVRKEGVSGKPADIWSMGVTLYCLKFGKVPFQKQAVLDLYESIVNDPLDLDPDCDKNFANLMLRLFEKDPEMRIKMEELRVHPWVTKNGIDPLLSKEENCADSVTPPTEEEKDFAITNNMGRLIAVLRAANRFKTLLRQRNPDLMESILNRASRIVQPPLSMSSHQSAQQSESDHSLHQAGSDLKSELKEIFRSSRNTEGRELAPYEQIKSSGIYRDTDVHTEIKHITEQLKRHFTSRQKTVDARMELATTSESTDELSQIREEHDKNEIQNRRHSFDNAKGHAHDPLEDQLFLAIGQGPEEPAQPDEEDSFIVSESPQPTNFEVFEEAYKEEVQKIHKSGRKPTIFLTRRVDRNPNSGGEQDSASSSADSLGQGSRRARMADFVGRAWQERKPSGGADKEEEGEQGVAEEKEENEEDMASPSANPLEQGSRRARMVDFVGKARQKADNAVQSAKDANKG